MKKCNLFLPGKTVRARAGQLAAAGVAVLAVVLVLAVTGFYRCPLRWTLGIACPGCGMTRAAVALLRLDLAGAFALNPLIFLVAAYAVLLSAAWLWQPKLLRARVLWVVLIGAFAVFWVVRLVLFLNGQNPDFYEPDALFPRIFNFLKMYL